MAFTCILIIYVPIAACATPHPHPPSQVIPSFKQDQIHHHCPPYSTLPSLVSPPKHATTTIANTITIMILCLIIAVTFSALASWCW